MESHSTNWPHWTIEVPRGADDEQIACVMQAAADAGALGGHVDSGRLFVYLPREQAEFESIRLVVEREMQRLGWPAADWTLHALADAPWATAWKATFTPLAVGKNILIRPDWEMDQPAPEPWRDRLTIWIRPGLGFGTGRHESTRLALERLEEVMRPGIDVLDFGAGNAVLAMVAAKMGARRVLAIENDPQAIPNAGENIDLNGLAGTIELREAAVPPGPGEGLFDLIVCNVIPRQAGPHFKALSALLKDVKSSVIYSGFLADEKDEIETALREVGLEPCRFTTEAEWGAWLAGPGSGAPR
ncbi:50S ribosomal protein L11 methyltransferase [bacterium]|nr:50S ribosomal protein L11 methyltransferase [bacterium]